MNDTVQTSALRVCFQKLGKRMAQEGADGTWEDSVIDVLSSGKHALRIKTSLVNGAITIEFEPSEELLRHL